ncbi:glycosyltransferase family 2 protein [Mariniflexile litorale]|uniref:Glycosyltransferase family 2 protein n=1 Tax=Mariniflexile litorale TaxID=3045158 RepID=A0AAU7ECV1_9FLAO|nr:glycosyltransferase family 2 protein [Mariniflexile sp. KMM 9835]MDQ8212220.1 glycosyltransferase family 2 protein [Mariniflexile sp. KMM 9835]
MMLFSILIANYNNGSFFKDCYASVIVQTYENWEVIIVDDASTDNSVELIKKIIGNDTRFKLFTNKENKGCGYAKHKCVSLAEGGICGFLDPDDALFPNAITEMVQIHKEHNDVSIVTSKYELVDLKMNTIEEGNHGSAISFGKSYLTSGAGAMTHFATFKKEKYNVTVGIDAKMKRAVDQDLYFKMEEVGTVVFLNEVLYRYRIHEQSISANENKFKAHYWHFYAMINAYKRRKKNKIEIDNFTKQEIKIIKSNYYMSRFARAKKNNNHCVKRYFLLKAIVTFPSYNLKHKLKSLF